MARTAKKLINQPEKVVVDALNGLVACSPHLQLLDGLPDTKVVYDSRAAPCENVALVSGGGSGHEPAHVGYVGQGMLSGAVCGDVFASPPASAVLAAIRKVTGKAGCLLIVKNYTGDRLNFGLAAEQARCEGFLVEMVVIGEDCAVSGGIAGRRGLAGTLFVHKVAGAAAHRGEDLGSVARVAREVAARIGTVGVALSLCTLPGAQVSSRLGEDEIEIGLGIHGEPGAEVGRIALARDIVKQTIDKMVNSDYFPVEKGESVVVMVNNLGTTPESELCIVGGETVAYLKEEFGLNVEAVYVGTFMTALDMAGVSITLCKVNEEILTLLQHPTSARGWVTEFPTHVGGKSLGSMPVVDSKTPELVRPDELTPLGSMIQKAIQEATTRLQTHEDDLTKWDTISGDGDCGLTMSKGAKSIREDMQRYPLNDPIGVAQSLATSVTNSMGGTSGALYSIFFTAAAVAMNNWQDPKAPTPQDWYSVLGAGVDAIGKYGGAKEGYRTMLDALIPAQVALKEGIAGSKGVVELLEAAVSAALKGADATQSMTAAAGRASYVPQDLVKSVPDPGAKAVQFWLEGLLAAFQ